MRLVFASDCVKMHASFCLLIIGYKRVDLMRNKTLDGQLGNLAKKD